MRDTVSSLPTTKMTRDAVSFESSTKMANSNKLTLFCKYAVINSNAQYNIAFTNKVPQRISNGCDDVGIWRGGSFGWKCVCCYDVFQRKCHITRRIVDKRSKLFKKVLQCINKPYIVDDDIDSLISFSRTPKLTLTEDGKWLVQRAKSMSEYYHHSKKMPEWDKNLRIKQK